MSPVSDSPSRPGRQTADAPTFVLVHGSGTSSFMRAPVQHELALRGHRGYAVDLPGHGAEYGPVVLVGAGLGGTTITGVGNTIPALVSRLAPTSVSPKTARLRWPCGTG
jgi:pimeloyl-ACP methyl ester carboxylesterase